MTRLFIFGDSHSVVIARAQKQREARTAPLAATTVVGRMAIAKKLEDGSVVTGGVSYPEAIASLVANPDAAFVSVIGGNASNTFGMMQHPVPFDYFEPDLPDAPIDAAATIIPVAILEQQFDQFLRNRDWKMILSLREPFAGRAFHLAPPPPKEDNDFIARNAESQFRQLGIEKMGVSPPFLRLKLWHLQKRIMDRLCESADMRQLPPPADALTPEGFLAPAFYGADATHANIAYGERVLAMLDERVLTEEGVA